MATTTFNGAFAAPARPAARPLFQPAFAAARNAVVRYARYVHTRNKLNDLSDAMLADIGIERDGIPALAHRSVYGD